MTTTNRKEHISQAVGSNFPVHIQLKVSMDTLMGTGGVFCVFFKIILRFYAVPFSKG